MNKRVLMVAVGIGVLCAGLIAFNFIGAFLFAGAGFMQPPPTGVETVTVQPGPWEPGIEAVGTARANQGADVAAEIAGTVKEIKFKPNTRAKAGELLVQIDDSVERADLIAAEANTKLYGAQLARSRALVGKGFVSRASLDTVQAQLGVAKSASERAKAVIAQKSIEAPFDGTLGIARVDAGQYVAAGTVVVTLQDLDRIKVDFTIPEQTATALKMDQPVRFGVEKTNYTMTGKVIGIDPKADTSRMVAVQAQVENTGGVIRAGQFLAVRVDLPTENNVIALPQTAVMPSLYGDYVFVAAAPDATAQPPAQGHDGNAVAAPAPPAPQGGPQPLAAKQVFITVGRRDGRRVEITKGLKPGDKVIISGQNRLQNGAPVSLVETRPAAAEPATPEKAQ
jgi:membrane fusion protein (multidrug efflux system)